MDPKLTEQIIVGRTRDNSKRLTVRNGYYKRQSRSRKGTTATWHKTTVPSKPKTTAADGPTIYRQQKTVMVKVKSANYKKI